MTRRSLTAFLALIVLLQFGWPVTAHGTVWSVLYMPLWAVMLLVGVLIARSEHQTLWPYVVLGVVFTVSGVGLVLGAGNRVAAFGMYGAAALFVAGLIGVLLRRILDRSSDDGVVLILAAVCVYLLLGGMFVALYGMAETIAPGSIVDGGNPGAPIGWQRLIYFSYVTLATLGYGDVLPVSPWTRSLATLQTVIGTLFLAVVIARLVGLYAAREKAEETAGKEGG